MHVLTQDYLKSILDYNPETGLFIWKYRQGLIGRKKAWNTRFAGKEAGGVIKNRQHLQIMINNKNYKANRLAWLYVYGKFPECVDAIDRNYLNLKINNLRESTFTENSHKRINNSGELPVGVDFRKRKKSKKIYRSQITHNGKLIYLGCFETPEEAHEAYVEAKRMISPEYCML